MTKQTSNAADKFVSFVAAGIVVFACSGRASAVTVEDKPTQPTKVVSYADLNLDTPTGAAAFYRRIRAAAYEVCSSYDGGDLRSNTLHQQCVETAVSGGVSQLDRASAIALHTRAEGHSG